MTKKPLNTSRKADNEIMLTQYIRPSGIRAIVFAVVGSDYVKKAEGLILSTEVLTTGAVVIYGRKGAQDEDEEISYIADNGPGENSPTAVLKKLIDELFEKNS